MHSSRFSIFLLSLLLFAGQAQATQDPSAYVATCLTQGDNCLDAIDVHFPDPYNLAIRLQDGDVAQVISTTGVYNYVYDYDSGASESSPYVIKPDYDQSASYSGAGRWIVVGPVEQILTASGDCDLETAISTIETNAVATNLLLSCAASISAATTVTTSYTHLTIGVGGSIALGDGATLALGGPVTVKPDSGNISGYDGGETLTFTTTDIDAPVNHQFIDDTYLAVSMPPGVQISSRWFGDDGDAIMAAITAGSSSGTYVYVPSKTTTYEATETWDWATLAKPITLEGQQGIQGSTYGTIVEWTQTDGTDGITLGNIRVVIKNISLQGNSSAGNGIYEVTATSNHYYDNVEITGWGDDGYHGENIYNSTWVHCNFFSNGTSGTGYNLYLDGANNNYYQGLLSNGATALYMANASHNTIWADLNRPTGDYAAVLDDYCDSNDIHFWVDGTVEKAMSLSTLTYGNRIYSHTPMTRGVRDLGISNQILSWRTHTQRANRVDSFPTMTNVIRNSSALYGTAGWTCEAGLTCTQDTTTGGSTGTSHKIVFPTAGAGTSTNKFYQVFDDRPSWADGDTIVYKFLAKVSRAVLPEETIYCGLSGTGDSIPDSGFGSLDVTTDWREFTETFRIDGTPTGPYIYFKGWQIDASTITLWITDVTVVRNPQIKGNNIPNIFSGTWLAVDGDNGYWYPETTTPLNPFAQLPLLDAAPQNPRPGIFAHADGYAWDPLSNGDNASYFVYYGQSETINGANWTLSGATAGEYYIASTYSQPNEVVINGTIATEGTVGSLAEGEWDWADNDAIGESRVYVKITGGADPDSKAAGYILFRRWVGLTETDAK